MYINGALILSVNAFKNMKQPNMFNQAGNEAGKNTLAEIVDKMIASAKNGKPSAPVGFIDTVENDSNERRDIYTVDRIARLLEAQLVRAADIVAAAQNETDEIIAKYTAIIEGDDSKNVLNLSMEDCERLIAEAQLNLLSVKGQVTGWVNESIQTVKGELIVWENWKWILDGDFEISQNEMGNILEYARMKVQQEFGASNIMMTHILAGLTFSSVSLLQDLENAITAINEGFEREFGSPLSSVRFEAHA